MSAGMNQERIKVKLCCGCKKVKPLEGSYYRAGSKSYQKRCKICHNKKRSDYIFKRKEYIPRPTGFKKLPEELRHKIIYDIYVNMTMKDIWRKFKEEYPPLSHQSLLRWKREGQIQEYDPSIHKVDTYEE
jgi:hypothetical protein